jgi:integrase
VALKCGHIQRRDGRWVFVDLVGKGKRIRTVPIPPFVKVAIDAWTAPVYRKAPCSGGCAAGNIRKRPGGAERAHDLAHRHQVRAVNRTRR